MKILKFLETLPQILSQHTQSVTRLEKRTSETMTRLEERTAELRWQIEKLRSELKASHNSLSLQNNNLVAAINRVEEKMRPHEVAITIETTEGNSDIRRDSYNGESVNIISEYQRYLSGSDAGSSTRSDEEDNMEWDNWLSRTY